MRLHEKPCVWLTCCISLVVFLTMGVAAYEHTDEDIELTQYANIAPLPGACVAVNSDGQPDGLGAFQVNIPVAYTPGWGYASAGAFVGGHLRGSATEFGNGSGFAAMGFFTRPKVFISAMQVSHITGESKAFSFQASAAPETLRRPAISVGMQDVLEKEPNGRSPYVVATRGFLWKNRTVFATVGFGGGRFLDNPFGGLSTPLSEKVNLAVEHDGYQVNVGLGWRPGGRDGKLTLLGGYNGKCGLVGGLNAATCFGP